MKFCFVAQEVGYSELLVTGQACLLIITSKKSKPVPWEGRYSFHLIDEGTKTSKSCDLPNPVSTTAEMPECAYIAKLEFLLHIWVPFHTN